MTRPEIEPRPSEPWAINVRSMARGKELNNSQKALIVKLLKDGESYRNISSNLDISLTTTGSFMARFKRRNTVENKKKEQILQGRFLQDYYEN